MFKWMRENLKIIMIAVVVIFVISCFALYGISSNGDDVARPSDVIAKVDRVKVTRGELETIAQNLAQNKVRTLGQSATEADMADYRKKALDNKAIEIELKKEIKARKLSVRYKELNERIKTIEANFPSKKEFEAYLENAGITMDRLRAGIKFQMEQEKLADDIAKNIKVTDDQINRFYEEGKDTMFVKPAGFNVLVAVFSNKAAAETAQKAVASGESWDKIMKGQKKAVENYTKEAEADYIPKAQCTEKPLSDIALIENGKVSEVIGIQGTDKYVIFKKLSTEEEKQLKLEEVKSQIISMIQAQTGRMAMVKLTRQCLKRAKIEIKDPSYFEVPKDEAAPQQK